MKFIKCRSHILRNRSAYLILAVSLIVLIVIFSISRTNQSLRTAQNELLQKQLAELEIQNELKQEEISRTNLQESKRQEEYLKAKKCYADMINIIFPYYEYAETSFKYCLESGVYTLSECSQKRKDRIAELESKEDRSKIDCGLI